MVLQTGIIYVLSLLRQQNVSQSMTSKTSSIKINNDLIIWIDERFGRKHYDWLNFIKRSSFLDKAHIVSLVMDDLIISIVYNFDSDDVKMSNTRMIEGKRQELRARESITHSLVFQNLCSTDRSSRLIFAKMWDATLASRTARPIEHCIQKRSQMRRIYSISSDIKKIIF